MAHTHARMRARLDCAFETLQLVQDDDLCDEVLIPHYMFVLVWVTLTQTDSCHMRVLFLFFYYSIALWALYDAIDRTFPVYSCDGI